MSRHLDPRLQSLWRCAEIGLLIFPFHQLLGAIAISWAALGTWRSRYRTIISLPVNLGLVVVSIMLVITTIFAYEKLTALFGLFNFLPYFIVFAGFSTLIQTTQQLRQLAWIIVLPSPAIVLVGLGQLFLGWQLKIQILYVLIDWAIAPGGNPPGRMSANFSYANILAAYLVIVFILGLGLWIETYQNWQHHNTHDQHLPDLIKTVLPNSLPLKNSHLLIFLTIVVTSSFIALILTNSRNAWGITILACFTYAIYLGWRWLVATVTGLASLILLAAFAPAPINIYLRKFVPAFFWARLTDQMYPDRPVAHLRKTQWQFAWNMTQQRPLTGWGLRNFTRVYDDQMHVWLGHPHNFFLMLSAETGLITTLCFCAICGWVLVQAVQVYKQLKQDQLIFFTYIVAFLACTLFNTVDVTLFDLRVNTTTWLLLAGICGVVYQQRALVNPHLK